MRYKKIVFTGGHHNSALALATYLRDHEQTEIYWFGHKHTTVTNSALSAEYQEVTKENIPFWDIQAGKVYKTFNPIHWLRVPYGFLQAWWYLLRLKPDLIVSFGGYLAVPVVVAGWLFGIPAVTHEQTTVVGLANRVIGYFAKKIFVTWEDSRRFFPKHKTVAVGLPLRKTIFVNEPALFLFPDPLPTLYITAGKQGSHVINMAVEEVLEALLGKYNIIHQTGSHSTLKDFERLTSRKESLSRQLQNRYVLREYVFQDEIGSAFFRADLIVSRSGAHTVYELAALGKPAVLIPIPWSSRNEQFQNAEFLVTHGGAIIVPQAGLTGETLMNTIDQMVENIALYKQKAASAQQLINRDAIKAMADEIKRL